MKKNERKAYGISLMVSVVATAIGSGMMGVMLGSIVETYRLLTVQEGCMSSCISVGALAAGSAVTAVAWTWGILSGSPRAMLICCGVSGLGSGCCIPVLLSEGAAFSPENTGLTTSLLMMVKTAGQILMPLAVSALRAGLGETMGMLLIGITFLADAGAVLGMLLVQRKRKI